MSAEVVIAYDGSEFAKAAIEQAGRQLRPGRRALVLTISEPTESLPFLGASRAAVDDEAVESLVGAARSGAERTAEEGAELARAAGFEAESLVVDGAPIWHRIVAVADEQDAELIVIGSRGLSGLKYAVLGSVAAAVAQHTKRAIFIAHRR
jgi:nucleotide-binding universal stress UspA family protein